MLSRTQMMGRDIDQLLNTWQSVLSRPLQVAIATFFLKCDHDVHVGHQNLAIGTKIEYTFHQTLFPHNYDKDSGHKTSILYVDERHCGNTPRKSWHDACKTAV